MSPNHLPTLFTTLTAGVAACLAMLGVTAVADAAATRSCTRRRRGNPELPGVRGGDNVDCAEQPVGFAQFKRQSGKAPNVKRVVLGYPHLFASTGSCSVSEGLPAHPAGRG